jgi:hypothetical protein
MELTSKQRLAAFGAGAGFGLVLMALYWWDRGTPKHLPPPEPGVERRAVPGVLAQWTSSGQPIEGAFIVSQALGVAAADGSRLRGVVVPGLDPGTFIRIEEEWAPGVPPVVRAWKFMFADRVKVRLREKADTQAMAKALSARGWKFKARDPVSGWVTIDLGAHEAQSVPEGLKELRGWPQWVVDAQPDLLPPPESNGP